MPCHLTLTSWRKQKNQMAILSSSKLLVQRSKFIVLTFWPWHHVEKYFNKMSMSLFKQWNNTYTNPFYENMMQFVQKNFKKWINQELRLKRSQIPNKNVFFFRHHRFQRIRFFKLDFAPLGNLYLDLVVMATLNCTDPFILLVKFHQWNMSRIQTVVTDTYTQINSHMPIYIFFKILCWVALS